MRANERDAAVRGAEELRAEIESVKAALGLLGGGIGLSLAEHIQSLTTERDAARDLVRQLDAAHDAAFESVKRWGAP